MKALPFTIPVAHDKTILVQEDIVPYFYPYLHRHEEMQLTLILRGKGTLMVGNRMHSYMPGEMYLIGANIPHVFKSDASYFATKRKKRVHALTLFFSNTGKLAPLFELPELKQVHAFLSKHPGGCKIPEQAVEKLSTLLFEIRQTSGIDQFMLFFQLLKNLTSLKNIPPLASDLEPEPFSDHDGTRISRIYNYIMQHYNRNLTLEDVSAVAYMTPNAFCRYFKRHTRLTFISFLNKVRINEVCKQLIDGSHESVTAVAYNCGFNSIPNFNRVFKSVVGKSPREYTADFLKKVN